ncbi:MAG: proline dehydrogenase family protein [Anaerolineaceae bacterium]|nr:proline dehydrogenase family protein [Anaerolineaceae bacterium]
MLRTLLLFLSKQKWAQRLISNWKFAWRIASRFVAGETQEDALQVIQKLNERGIIATVDFIGENTNSPEEAHRAANEVLQMLEKLNKQNLRANVSVKLSQMGLALDPSLCQENMGMILQKARECNNYIRIDMEDSSLTDATIGIYKWAHDNGFENVGIVFQSNLFRSEEDIQMLQSYGVHVRMCKGAYKEPPEIAYSKKQQVDENFDRLTVLLFEISKDAGMPDLSDDGRVPPIPAIATHDDRRIKYAREKAEEMGLPKTALEFQLLHGIRRELQDELCSAGYPVRIYVPYGVNWYPYFMRRLAERPANLWFFVSNFFQK